MPKSEDGSMDGIIFERWDAVSLEVWDAFGKILRIPEEAKDRIIMVGFVDVVKYYFKIPVGPWRRILI